MNLPRRIVRLAYPFGSMRRVLRGPAEGASFFVGDGMGLSYALGMADAAPRFFAEWLRPGMTVYDVGANKGQMSLLFASMVGASGRIVALEPAPAEFEHLERNIEVNGYEFVYAIRAAAYREAGEVTFDYAEGRPTQGKLTDVEPTYGRRSATRLTVPAVRLDDMIDEYGAPDFVKVDVEGAAASVLEGAQRIIDEISPLWYLELHGPEEQAGVRDHLVLQGYTAQTLDGRQIDDPADGWNSPLWCFRS